MTTELGDLALSLSDNGTTLYMDRAAYGMGSDQAVRKDAGAKPQGHHATVVLAGPGGRIGAGFEISRMIRMFRERKLATRVETGCASACTIAFLGGIDRSIAPDGQARLPSAQASPA